MRYKLIKILSLAAMTVLIGMSELLAKADITNNGPSFCAPQQDPLVVCTDGSRPHVTCNPFVPMLAEQPHGTATQGSVGCGNATPLPACGVPAFRCGPLRADPGAVPSE